MPIDVTLRRWLITGLIALALAAASLAALLGLAAWHFYFAADYPGSARTSDHAIYGYAPLSIRRDTAYLTTDEFPAVYNWYSVGFELGPEQRAQSGCILMARSQTTLGLLRNSMSVTLCDTPKGRMVFVMRHVQLR